MFPPTYLMGKVRQMAEYSLNPAGEKFRIPEEKDYAAEFDRVSLLAAAARKQGKEVVVVMGVQFLNHLLTIGRHAGGIFAVFFVLAV